ncbi:MAG: peptide chain release factor 2 [Kiritimatiellae bacterium]|nr:peptide chain release factor 2 [Kiritimatiellia bacterium]
MNFENLDELKSRAEALKTKTAEMRGYFDIESKNNKLAELDKQTIEPDFWNNQAKAKEVIVQSNTLRAVIKPFESLESSLQDAEDMFELIELEEDDSSAELAIKEAISSIKKAQDNFEKLELHTLLNSPMDSNNAYLILHAGAGGTESCDWAEMLYRMYCRYAEKSGFEVELLELQPGDEAGIKSVTFKISGAYAYGYMKCERGVHRLVRISPFDSNSRRHTSFVALDVVAELPDDLEIEIEDKDLRIDTYRSSGSGGQHVNTTDSAVRLTHLPTGLVVACQAERSQHKNKASAMKMLKAKIYEYELDKKRKSLEQFYGSKGEIAWGSQIRSYVMQPYTMANDHRTGEKQSNVTGVLDGDIQLFIEAYLKQSAEQNQQNGE